jgi:hypothetical protein
MIPKIDRPLSRYRHSMDRSQQRIDSFEPSAPIGSSRVDPVSSLDRLWSIEEVVRVKQPPVELPRSKPGRVFRFAVWAVPAVPLLAASVEPFTVVLAAVWAALIAWWPTN